MKRETLKNAIPFIVMALAISLLIWDASVTRVERPMTVFAQSGASMQPGAKVTVTTAGTRVQLTSTVSRANGIYIEADEDNAGTIYIGTSTVAGDLYISRLTAGQGWGWSIEPGGPMINPSSIYIDASANTQSVQWGYY